MQELLLYIFRIGFLVLLWLFVLSAVLVVRSDLFGRSGRSGTSVRAPRQKQPGRASRSRRSTPRTLVVTQGALTGTTIALSGNPITIGRADDSTLVLADDYVSSRHARLVPDDGAWLVEDLGSTNGTYLDREKVTRPTPVPLGVPIRIGKTSMELRR